MQFGPLILADELNLCFTDGLQDGPEPTLDQSGPLTYYAIPDPSGGPNWLVMVGLYYRRSMTVIAGTHLQMDQLEYSRRFLGRGWRWVSHVEQPDVEFLSLRGADEASRYFWPDGPRHIPARSSD